MQDNNNVIKNKEIVLTELKDFHNQILKLKDTMENKANYFITYSGILIAFVVSFVALIDQYFIITMFPYIFTLVVLLFAGLCMYNSFSSLKIKKYNFLFNEDPKNKAYLENEVYTFREIKTSEQLLDQLTDSYITCSKLNLRVNADKEKVIKRSQTFLIITFIITVITILSLFIHA